MLDDLPNSGEVQTALRGVLIDRDNRPLSASDAYEILAKHFSLDANQLALRTADDKEPKWHNRCRTARNDMVKKGLLTNDEHDSWSLSDFALPIKSIEDF